MRKFKLTSQSQKEYSEEVNVRAVQVTELLALWSGLGSAGLTSGAQALHPLLSDNARFVVSLAQQYQNQGVNQEALVTAAHEVLITLLNQYAGRPDELDKVMAYALRDSMVAAIQIQTRQQL